MRFETPGHRVALLAFELLPALGGMGDFEAAGLKDHAPIECGHSFVGFNAPLGEQASCAGVVVLEHQARCVRGGAPIVEKRALIEHDDIAPSHFGEVIGGATADDASADDDDLGVRFHGTGLLVVCDNLSQGKDGAGTTRKIAYCLKEVNEGILKSKNLTG